MAKTTPNNNRTSSQELGLLGTANGSKPRISVADMVGADLTRLDMPRMLEVLRGVYERKGDKLIYRPRAFRARTQSGTLTDLQASMFKNFQSVQDEFNTLLDALTPLNPAPDKEDWDAIRALVREDVNELVEEAGWVGGPRGMKFDSALAKCRKDLSQLRGRFGLNQFSNVKTSEEAENWARIIRMVEIIDQMDLAYQLRKQWLDRTRPESFGNQLVWLERSLKTLREAALRFQTQLAEAGVGPEELSTKTIPGRIKMSVAELLQWTAEVCDKGTLLGSRAGKIGIESLWEDLNNLGEGYTVLYEQRQAIGIDELDDEEIQDTLKDINDAIVAAMNVVDSQQPQRVGVFVARFLREYQRANPNGTPRQVRVANQQLVKDAYQVLKDMKADQTNQAASVKVIANQQKILAQKAVRENMFYRPDSGQAGTPLKIYVYVEDPGQCAKLADGIKKGVVQLRLSPLDAKNAPIVSDGAISNGNVFEFTFDKLPGTPGAYEVEIIVEKNVWPKFYRFFVIEQP